MIAGILMAYIFKNIFCDVLAKVLLLILICFLTELKHVTFIEIFALKLCKDQTILRNNKPSLLQGISLSYTNLLSI